MFFCFLFFILLGCKYVLWIYITVFVLKWINLFNAYILLFLHILLFVLLTGNKSRGWKHRAYLTLSRPCINTFIIHVILFIYVLLFPLWVMIKKWYSFHCIYWYVTYYVLLCRIWSDVLWSLLVKIILFRVSKSWQKINEVTKS